MMTSHKRDNVAASADAVISMLPSLNTLSHLDWSVINGIKHSAIHDLDLSDWSNLRHYIHQHSFESDMSNGFLERLMGYVEEVKDAHIHAAQGQHIEWPNAPNQPGYDFIADGQSIQTKIGDVHSIHEHFERYPDIPLDTHLDNFTKMLGYPLVTGFQELDPQHIHDVTVQTLDVVENGISVGTLGVPIFTFSAIKFA